MGYLKSPMIWILLIVVALIVILWKTNSQSGYTDITVDMMCMNGWPRDVKLPKHLLSDQVILAYDTGVASDHISIQLLSTESASKGRGRQIHRHGVGNHQMTSSDVVSRDWRVIVTYSIALGSRLTCNYTTKARVYVHNKLCYVERRFTRDV